MFLYLIMITLSLVSTLFLTYTYFISFYTGAELMLIPLFVSGGIICAICTLPLKSSKSRLVWVLYLFAPFFILYSLTHNGLFALLSVVSSMIITILLSREKTSSTYLFTPSGTLVVIEAVHKKTLVEKMRIFIHTASVLLTAIFFLTLALRLDTPLWGVKLFPNDFSVHETLPQNAVPSGMVTSNAWYDPGAMLVGDFYTVIAEDGRECSPGKEAGLRANDVIVKINGKTALESDFISSGGGGEPIALTVKRLEEDGTLSEHTLTVTPVFSPEQDRFLIGITYYSAATMAASVQTVAFYYPEKGYFAATAHSSDDVYDDMTSLEGYLIASSATGRDESGLTVIPREVIGTTVTTDNYGSYGVLTLNDGEALPIALKGEIRLGKATLLSAFEGGKVKEYEVYVTGTYRIDSRDVICLAVTDETIVKAGGITRGMSGSPIIQNGKIIGALSNMDEGGYRAYATYAHDMAHHIYMYTDKLDEVLK